jgi:ribosomal protein S18 acetylase RimI-like enzyme
MEGLFQLRKTEQVRANAVVQSAFEHEITIMVEHFGLKRKAAAGLFQMPCMLCLKQGEVYATSPDMEGIIAFAPSEHSNFGLMALIRSGAFFKSLGAIKLMYNKAMRTTFASLNRAKKALAIGPYYYLSVLGVTPPQQGNGYGTKLLSALCARADREQRALYLETQTEANVSWYEHFGFETLAQLGSAETFQIWQMVRQHR